MIIYRPMSGSIRSTSIKPERVTRVRHDYTHYHSYDEAREHLIDKAKRIQEHAIKSFQSAVKMEADARALMPPWNDAPDRETELADEKHCSCKWASTPGGVAWSTWPTESILE